MSGNYLAEAAVFLISTLFSIYILIVMLRFLLQCVRADFYNPISQFVVTVSNPPLRILRRCIPGYKGIDMPSLLLLVLLQMMELMLIGLIGAGRIPAFAGLLVLSVTELLKLVIYIFLFSILVQVVISWVNPHAYNPVTVLLHRLTEPLLSPARRVIPPISGLDLSPLVVLIGLQLMLILVIQPLMHLGYKLAGYLVV